MMSLARTSLDFEFESIWSDGSDASTLMSHRVWAIDGLWDGGRIDEATLSGMKGQCIL